MDGDITVRFGNGTLNGGMDVWEFIGIIITDQSLIRSVTSHNGIWEVVVKRPEPEREPESDECIDHSMWDDECKMCGRERNLNEHGYCSSCWVIWNS